MKKFTIIFAVLMIAAFTIQAQLNVGTGLYEFANPDNLWENTATGSGVGTIMCEGIMKYDEVAQHSDTTSVAGTDYSVIDGINNKAIALKAHNWFKIWHGIPANGGGEWVNDWTVLLDVRVADAGGIYSLHEVNYDASESGYSSEMEIADMKVGAIEGAVASGVGIPYSEMTLEVNTWYRIAYVGKLAEYIKIFVDGIKVTEVTGDWTDGRPAPYNSDTRGDRAAFKVGGNNETIEFNDPARDGDKDIDLVAVFGTALSEGEIATLGAAGDGTSSIKQLMEHINPFRMYPNPAQDILHVQVYDLARVDIINTVGQIVKTSEIDTETVFKVNDLNKGVYFVKVTYHTGDIASKKVIIE